MKLDINIASISVSFLSFFLALPLVVQTFPYLGWIFFACIPSLFFMIYLISKKDCNYKLFTNSSSIVIFLLIIIFFYGMLLDVKSVSNAVIKDLVRGAAFLLATVFLLQLKNVGELDVLKKIVETSRIIILISGVIGAGFGLLKYWFAQFGYEINFFYNSIGEYPWGTSLVTDYNFYSLSLLIALLISLQFWRQSVSTKKSLIYSCIAGVLLSAGVLSGSRRYLIFVVFLLLILFLYILFKGLEPIKRLRWKELFAAIFVTLSLIFGVIYITNYVIQSSGSRFSALDARLEARVERLVAEPTMAVYPRVDRWAYALQLIKPSELLSGSGFSYRQEFGCKFDACKGDDYPHAPILSALLYGGVLGFLIVAGAFFCALQTVRRILSSHGNYLDIALGLTATILFVSISGDSLFSVPVFFSMLLISRCVVGFK